MFEFLFENGVVHEPTCLDTPQQNGNAERKNRHLLKVIQHGHFFSKCMSVNLITVYLISQLPPRVLNGLSLIKSMSSFFPSIPFLSNLHKFECVVFVHIHWLCI